MITHHNQHYFKPPLNVGEIESLRSWLDDEAITVPEGWLEACLDWLSEQAAGDMNPNELKDAIYQQWLHADLNELACPILPDQNSIAQGTLLLEGELCLQVSALINIGESYYGQLRKYEGNIGIDLPDLETEHDPEESSIDLSFQLSNFSTQSSTFAAIRAQNKQQGQNPATATYALHLTDGVTTIRAVELGSKYSPHGRSPEECFRAGAKVKLRGPLKLLKGVLMLPAGSISSPEASSQSRNAQCKLLGGEVDFTDPGQNEPDLLLQRELLIKLNLPPDDPPDWFPGRRVLPATITSGERTSTVTGTDRRPNPPAATEPSPRPPVQQNQPARPLRRALFSTDENFNQLSVNRSGPIQSVRPKKEEIHEELIETEALFDDDDYLLASAVENFENMASTDAGDIVEEPFVPKVPPRSPDLEPDDDFFFSNDPSVEALLQEIDFSPHSDHGAPYSPPKSSPPSNRVVPTKRPCLSPEGKSLVTSRSGQQAPVISQRQPVFHSASTLRQQNFVEAAKPSTSAPPPPQKQMIFQQPNQPAQRTLPTASASLVQKNVRSVLPQSSMSSSQVDIRRYLGSGGPHQHPVPHRSTASGEEAQNPIPAFAYLQDVYHNIQRRRGTRGVEIASIRGMLVSVLSRLEHHEGTRWSLTVRVSDGSATVDAEVEDELLRRLIGLSAVEAEAMRRLGRQGDECQKKRLKEIINTFQLKLCHFNGIFEVAFPGFSASTTPVLPKIRRFRPLDRHWLALLQNRAF